MTRRVLSVAILMTVVFLSLQTEAFAQSDPDVFVSTGPTSEILLGLGGTGFGQLFTAKGGFKPEEITLAGDGKLYICDSSSSQVFRLDPANTGAGLVTIYDRNSAVSPNDPEQPKGCTIAGDDLLFLSRNGRGGNAKTGLWAIQGVTTMTPSQPTLLLGLDSVGGVSGESLAVNFDGRVFFTFGNEVWVSTPERDAGRITATSEFRLWASTTNEGFGIATKGVPDSSGSLETQVFVAAKFSGVIEVLREGDGIGTPGECSVIDVPAPDLPSSLEFDGSGDLWIAASEQSSGRRGAVYQANDPVCGPSLTTASLVADGLSGAVGIALTPTGSDPVTLTFPEGSEKADGVNMCNSLFNLDRVVEACQDTWTVSCRLMPQAEFALRTDNSPFVFTTCADFPSAAGNCAEIRITQVAPSACVDTDIINILANWQFYSLSSLDHPGLLYSPDDFGPGGPEDNPFTENILVDYDPTPVPTDPLDPRATGSRPGWGSGIVVVDGAPNRPPTAVLTLSPAVAQCGETVLFDGADSFDNDWNVDGPDAVVNWAFSVDGVLQQSAMVDFYSFDTTGLAAGDYPVSLEVTDEGWDAQGALTDTVEETLTIVADDDAPVINQFELDDLGDPRVVIDETTGNATMWPPNHEMVAFKVLYDAFDACQSDCSLVIASNEPENGTGDGDVAPDWEITGETAEAFFFNLRTERAQSGVGRTYTIRLDCTDGTNSSSSSLITVFVPSSQSGGN